MASHTKSVVSKLGTYEKATMVNNYAAVLIESGKFEEAISLLKFALELLREIVQGNSEEARACRDCIWDGFIVFSEENASKHTGTEQCTIASSSSKINPSDRSPNSCTGNNHGTSGKDWFQRKEENRHRYNFMHTQPIRVRCEGHCSMEGNIHPIVTFNIALAYHLRAILAGRMDGGSLKCQMKKALALYELAHAMQGETNKQQVQKKYQEQNSVQASNYLRFGIMLLYNASHIHRLLSDTTKYRYCLEELLSIERILAGNDS
eukprot:jgi/Psemu1/289060/fgenesh1_pg.314_\